MKNILTILLYNGLKLFVQVGTFGNLIFITVTYLYTLTFINPTLIIASFETVMILTASMK